MLLNILVIHSLRDVPIVFFIFSCVDIFFSAYFMGILSLPVEIKCRDEYNEENGWFHREGEKLTEVPDYIPEEALNVDLKHNEITILEANVFSHLSLCAYLDLDYNLISEIELNAFNGLVSLKTFNLRNNRFTHIKAGVFSKLPTCSFISVGQNH